MSTLSAKAFLKSLPDSLRPHLPAKLQNFQTLAEWGLLKIHYGERALHYEVGSVGSRPGRSITGWELGFHCESKDRNLNLLLLDGFQRNLFEIKAVLGESIEAEMWDRGWTKIYEVYPEGPLTAEYRDAVAARLAAIIACIHPVFVDLRRSVAQFYR